MYLLINEVPFQGIYTYNLMESVGEGRRDEIINRLPWFSEEYSKVHVMAGLYGHESFKKMFKYVFGNPESRLKFTKDYWIWTFSTRDEKHTVWPMVNENQIVWEYHVRSNVEVAINIRIEVEKRIMDHYLR